MIYPGKKYKLQVPMKKDCFHSTETGNFTGSFSWAKWFSVDGPTPKLISGKKTFPLEQIKLPAIETTISKENTIQTTNENSLKW